MHLDTLSGPHSYSTHLSQEDNLSYLSERELNELAIQVPFTVRQTSHRVSGANMFTHILISCKKIKLQKYIKLC